MATYPISVKRDLYRGTALAKKAKAQAINKLAARIEAYVNQRAEEQLERSVQYDSKSIAYALGVQVDETFRLLCKSIAGGHHKFVVVREDLPLPPREDF